MSLSAYMQLPIEQYFVLNPSQITFIGGSRFQLHVPRINVSACSRHAAACMLLAAVHWWSMLSMASCLTVTTEGAVNK